MAFFCDEQHEYIQFRFSLWLNLLPIFDNHIQWFHVSFLFAFTGTGNSPAQSSTRSISPNSNSPGQFIHQQLHNSSGTTLNLAVTAVNSPQQPVCIYFLCVLNISLEMKQKYRFVTKWNIIEYSHKNQLNKW